MLDGATAKVAMHENANLYEYIQQAEPAMEKHVRMSMCFMFVKQAFPKRSLDGITPSPVILWKV